MVCLAVTIYAPTIVFMNVIIKNTRAQDIATGAIIRAVKRYSIGGVVVNIIPVYL